MKRNTAEIRGGKVLRKKNRVVELKKRKGIKDARVGPPVWRLAHGRRGRRFICLSRNVLHVSS